MRAQVVCLALVVLVNTCKTIAFQYKNPKYNITMLQEAIDKKALEWNTTLSVAISMGPGMLSKERCSPSLVKTIQFQYFL